MKFIKNLFTGRLGRSGFFWMPFAVVLVSTPFFFLYYFFQNDFVLYVYATVVIVLFFTVHFSIFVRRAHDLDWNTGLGVLFAVLTLIPYLGLVFYLILLFKKGTQGANRYGEPDTSKDEKMVLNNA